MLRSPRDSVPQVGLGMASVAISTIGMLFFFVPVMGIPVSLGGLALAVAGAVSKIWRPSESLRWSLAGIFCSLTALGIGLVINDAPVGEERQPKVPSTWRQ